MILADGRLSTHSRRCPFPKAAGNFVPLADVQRTGVTATRWVGEAAHAGRPCRAGGLGLRQDRRIVRGVCDTTTKQVSLVLGRDAVRTFYGFAG